MNQVVGNIQFGAPRQDRSPATPLFKDGPSHCPFPTSKYIDDLVKGMTLAQLVGGIRSPGYPERLGHYQYANKGGIFFPCDPKPDEVHIEDIAQALSRIHRFNGQTKLNSTVAEHCWICSHQVKGSPEKKLAALLHDGAEAYIGDMVRPLKYLPVLGSLYLKIEAGIETAIGLRFALPTPFLNDPDIKEADEMVAAVEVRENIASTTINHLTDRPNLRRDAAKNSDIILYHWEPKLAEQFFLQRFHELSKAR
jgi:5'-deoxynucleotidase YfbR-like HD superfamily hydrolase